MQGLSFIYYPFLAYSLFFHGTSCLWVKGLDVWNLQLHGLSDWKLDSTVFQVRGHVDFLWAIAAGSGAEERQSPQNPAMLSESNQDIRYISSIHKHDSTADILNATMTSQLIQYCTLYLLEIMRSNGFCLANTETIVFDHSLPEEKERPSSTDSVEHTLVLRPLLLPSVFVILFFNRLLCRPRASKQATCLFRNVIVCSWVYSKCFEVDVDVTQPQDPSIPYRKCVCAPLPSLGVCGKQKRNTFLSVLDTKQVFASLSNSWNYITAVLWPCTSK